MSDFWSLAPLSNSRRIMARRLLVLATLFVLLKTAAGATLFIASAAALVIASS
jgi:hypothetical protein